MRYAVVVTTRCRALVEVEADSKAEARAKARRLDVASDGRAFDSWQPIYTPLHVEAGAADPLDSLAFRENQPRENDGAR